MLNTILKKNTRYVKKIWGRCRGGGVDQKKKNEKCINAILHILYIAL